LDKYKTKNWLKSFMAVMSGSQGQRSRSPYTTSFERSYQCVHFF